MPNVCVLPEIVNRLRFAPGRNPPRNITGKKPTEMKSTISKSKEDPMTENMEQDNLIELTADIVSAYVSNNSIQSSDLPALISDVHTAMHKTLGGPAEPEPEPQKPAVSIKKSVTPDYIICLDDGKKFKSLKRHLRTHYDLTPEDYREKWGLPADYPMVAPNYAKARSMLAKKMGLGQKRGKRK
jgi:predicted transcriptional regulator